MASTPVTTLIYLENAVSTFAPNEGQIHDLASRLPGHDLVPISDDREFLERLPAAEIAVVWRFLPEWYALGPRLAHVCTPAAGRESVALDPSRRVHTHFGTFHGPIMAESLLGM